MPTTPEREQSGASADREEALTAAEAAYLAARDAGPAEGRRAPRVADDIRTRETVRLPVQRAGRGLARRAGRAPLAVAAAVAVGWAFLLTYLPVVGVMWLAQFVEGTGSAGSAGLAGLAAWLLGNGVPFDTPAGRFGLAPLGLAILAGWRLACAGVHTSRAIGARQRGSPRQSLHVAGSIGLAYGVIGLIAGIVVNAEGPAVSAPRAGATLAVFGFAAALVGALRTTAALGTVARWTPPFLRDALRTGVVAALLILGAGAGFVGLALALSAGDASDMIGTYRTGVAGQAGITLISAAFAPNAAVWAAAYLLGPGFAVGTETTVGITEVSVGALPAVPIFAALPGGPIGGLGIALPAIPVVAAMLAGWLLNRRLRRAAGNGQPPVRWVRLLAAAATAGPVAGLCLGAAALVASGSLGDGRLSQLGPVAWQVALVGGGVVAVGTLIGAAASRAFVGVPPA